MKKFTLFVAALFAVVGTAHANYDAAALVQQIAMVNASPIANVINWKVGEFQDMNISLQGMAMGTIHKEATSEEGNALWLKETMAGAMIGNHVVEVLLDRADGHVLKMKQDGQEKPVPTDKLEIIDQETATVTVPAGTFETIHIRAKSEQGPLEVWANPQAITLDGTAKMTMTAQGMPIGMELTKFGGK
jgi:hypothetical protein